jgi:isatin hydrolase
MAATDALATLARLLLSGEVEVVDLAGPLGPDTPLLKLPPELAVDTPKIEIHPISRYDENGPWWAWNWLKLGEHSGTHFDAPQHWISGRDHPDGSTDTIPPQRFVAPANVIDCSAEAARDPDYLLTADAVRAWEAEHGEIAPGRVGPHAHRLAPRQPFRGRVPQHGRGRPPLPRPLGGLHRAHHRPRRHRLGLGDHRHRRRPGGGDGPPFPAHNLMHKANRYGLASLANLDRLPAKGAILIAGPLKIVSGTGSPVRALALVPRA